MTELTATERETLYGPIGNDESYPELPGVVADIMAARNAKASRLVDEFEAGGDLTPDRAAALRAALAAPTPTETEEGQHAPLAVIEAEGMSFVRCACDPDGTRPQSAVWIREHWKGDEDTGVAALRAVIARQARAKACTCNPYSGCSEYAPDCPTHGWVIPPSTEVQP